MCLSPIPGLDGGRRSYGAQRNKSGYGRQTEYKSRLSSGIIGCGTHEFFDGLALHTLGDPVQPVCGFPDKPRQLGCVLVQIARSAHGSIG